MARTYRYNGVSTVEASVRDAHAKGKHGNPTRYAGICSACRAGISAKIFHGPVSLVREY